MDNGLQDPLDEVMKKTSEATGVSGQVASTLEKEVDSAKSGVSTSKVPKSIPESKNKNPNINEFRFLELRTLIINMYTVHKEIPTLKRIHEMSQKELGLRLSYKTLRKILIEIMGYKYMRLKGFMVIIEDPETRLMRMQYLRTIRQKNAKGSTTTIMYLDEMWLYAQYVICRDNKKFDAHVEWTYVMSDYRSALISAFHQTPVIGIDPKDLENWLKNVLIKNLPSKRVVIVMENASTNSVTTEPWITPYSRKMEMIIWLFKNNIPFESNMSNIELYGLVKEHRAPKKYVIDETLKEKKHEVLRLPPFCSDLHPLKLIQRFVYEKVALSKISDAKEVEAAIQREFQAIQVTDWAREVEYVKCLEQEYVEQELQMERELEKYISDQSLIDIGYDAEINIEEDI